jgi:hypothetical protein
MARDTRAAPSYSIDISPVAWRQLASIPQDAYLLVQQRLRELAVQAAEGRLPGYTPSGGIQREAFTAFSVGNVIARCVADGHSRIVRLMMLEYPQAPASIAVKDGEKSRLFE